MARLTQEASHAIHKYAGQERSRYHKLAALAISQTKSWWKMLEHLGNVKKRYHPWNESHGYLAGSVGRGSQRPRWRLSCQLLHCCYSPITWELCHRHYWKACFFAFKQLQDIGKLAGLVDEMLVQDMNLLQVQRLRGNLLFFSAWHGCNKPIQGSHQGL